MNTPANFKYSKAHIWVDMLSESTAAIGITFHAQKELSDIVYANLPAEGEVVEAGSVIADLESVKTVSDIICPVAGTVIEVNGSLDTEPGQLNSAPYETWLCKIEVTATDELLTAEEYDAFVAMAD